MLYILIIMYLNFEKLEAFKGGGGETIADKLKHIPNDDTHDTPSVDYNWWLKRLVTELNEPTHQNSIKIPKDVESTT